ncbi:MAG: hypothetical protein IJZ85_02655 [Lachnospiraceae bacterium]|nr:hypothetical protein [Lachnospiraceae bacterium]
MYCILELRDDQIRSLKALPDELFHRLISARDNGEVLFALEVEMLFAEEALAELDAWCETATFSGEFLSANLRKAESLCRDFLSALRAYVDHTKTLLRQRYGKNSPLASQFDRLSSTYYENHQSYSFVSVVRNYGQHCSNVVHCFGGNRQAADGSAAAKGSGIGKYPAAEPERLLREYAKWDDGNRRYIRTFSRPINLREEFHSALGALREIHGQTLESLCSCDNRAEDIRFLCEFAEKNYDRQEILTHHLAKIVHVDGGEATVDDFYAGKVNGFDVQQIDWRLVFCVGDRLSARKVEETSKKI